METVKSVCQYLIKSHDLFIARRVIFVTVYLIGAVTFYSYYENWSGLDSIFFIISTISTVGKVYLDRP